MFECQEIKIYKFHKKNYTVEELINIAKNCKSKREFAEILGTKYVGRVRPKINGILEDLNIDFSFVKEIIEKFCPKCNEKHFKQGVFCSRTCANGRPKSEGTKEKLRQAAIKQDSAKYLAAKRWEGYKKPETKRPIKPKSDRLLITNSNCYICNADIKIRKGLLDQNNICKSLDCKKVDKSNRAKIFNYKNYTDEDIIENSKHVFSISGLLRSLGLREAGGNFDNMKRNLHRLKVDTSHWTGSAWTKGAQLKDWSKYSNNHHVRKHLTTDRGHKCEGPCNLSEWYGFPIPIELHHIDGNRLNNQVENLQLLCANCHSLTDNFRNKKKK